MKEDALNLKKLIKDPKHVVITTHLGPDGDAMGSSLAIFNFLKRIGHNVTVITPNKYAEFLHWIAGNNEVIIYEGNEKQAKSITTKADLFFLLDFNNMGRIGDLCLTSLNDLSRNRTLGLLIGKGFFNSDYKSNSVILEGLSAIKICYNILEGNNENNLPIFCKLYNYISNQEKGLEFNFNDLGNS